jgi:von Willebrand factor type A domain
MHTLLPILAAASLLLTFPLQKSGAARAHTRRVFVSVVDRAGTPVADLGPADFEVTEGGVKRQAAHAGLETSPMRIALVVDTSDGAAPALTHLRAGLLAFIDALPPQHEIMMVSTGRQSRVRVPPTTDRKKIRDAASGLFSDGGAAVLMDSLLEADDRFMRNAEDRWPVFVIVTGDGAEGSAGAHERKFNEWVAAVPARAISAHALVLKYNGGGVPEIIAGHLVQAAGGRYDFMNTSNSLPDKLKALGETLTAEAKQMSTWYQVGFQTDAPDLAPVEIAVARSGVKIRVSNRRGLQ